MDMDFDDRMPVGEDLGHRLKALRATMKRSLRDCATILDMPVADYLAHENGEKQFSLPQLELLSLFLGVSPDVLIKEINFNDLPLHYLQDGRREGFQKLRTKMIRSRLSFFLEKADIGLDALSDHTRIPVENLEKYTRSDQDIPIADLIKIAGSLNQPVDEFIMAEFPATNPKPHKTGAASDDPFNPEEEMYHDLVQGLRKIPKEDLARLAKVLLNILKSN
jgi:transcriptional regulator with XRE-family HTH domain